MKKILAIIAIAASMFAVNAQAQNAKSVAAAKAAVDKAQAAVENAKQNMLDGDYNTRWTSNNVKGEYAIFDLGTEENIDTIGLAFWKGNVRNYSFTVLVSSDGKNWEEVFDGANSGTSENMEIFDIYSTGRYIKIVHNGNTNNNNCNILEFRAFRYE